MFFTEGMLRSLSHLAQLLRKFKSNISGILSVNINLTLRAIFKMEHVLEEKILEVK